LFNISQPPLRTKQKEVDVQDLCGLVRIHWQFQQKTLISNIYTRIDQVFIVWGLITAAIFCTAHFFPISWRFQAILWSILTLIGTVAMVYLTDFWVKVEKLRWVAWLWTALMLLGLGITNWGIFSSIPVILLNLCPLWLALSAVGYIIMGLGMYSRTFICIGLFHLLGIMLLPYLMGWQFLTTGFIMSSSLLVLAELQWDMRPPLNNSDVLSAEELSFNRRQDQLRQNQQS
jgi:hypothetical protein